VRFPAEPFKIKVVEPIAKTTREQRHALIREAGFNIFNIPSKYIYVDLLTDSGTAAMSDNQWAGMMLGDESYAGSRNYYNFEDTIHDITGYKFVIPAHQGRVAENLLFSTVVSPGMVVPNNIHFDTTRANVISNGGIALDLVIDEGRDPVADHPFKGNMDPLKLERAIAEHGPGKIPLVMMTVTNNSGGGQPVSMANMVEIRDICHRHKIPFFLDAARYAENCYFIKIREPGYEHMTVREIAQKMFRMTDGCTMSAKKDGLVNIGGFLGVNDPALAERLTNKLILIEGFVTYGGLAGRDLEATARGLEEALQWDYLHYRISQVKYLGELLMDAGVPIVKPVGGHAVYINAKEFVHHIPQSEFPGQALVVALYREAGIRAVEIGSLMFAEKDAATGTVKYPELELVRLAIPRRVYTTSHINYVAESIIGIYKNRKSLRGLKLTYEAPVLRHFTARMEELG
jgi:tyrosine phenol-lyase